MMRFRTIEELSPNFLFCYPLEGGVKFWAWLNVLILPIKQVLIIIIFTFRAEIFYDSYLLKTVHHFNHYHKAYRFQKTFETNETWEFSKFSLIYDNYCF